MRSSLSRADKGDGGAADKGTIKNFWREKFLELLTSAAGKSVAPTPQLSNEGP